MSIKTQIASTHIDSLVVNEKITDVINCRVRKFRQGLIALSGLAICQFMEGAELFTKSVKSVNSEDVQLMLKLSKSIRSLSSDPSVKFTFTYGELTILRTWLEMRMKHCEQERYAKTTVKIGDVEREKFNPDTYIGQKLLLLDLREALLGEIVEQAFTPK